MTRTALITVGSTKFDILIEHVTSTSCLDALKRRGYSHLIIQYGNSQWQPLETTQLLTTAYDFKPSLAEDIKQADLVISHAGSGTILDTLRSSKPLIVVPNNTLMDDHQSELANELSQGGYLIACSAETLAATIDEGNFEHLKPFPQQDKTRFRDILDEEMGFQ